MSKIKLILLGSLVILLIGITPVYADNTVVQDINCRHIQLEIDKKIVLIDSKHVESLETAPYIKNDFTMVPIRFVSEALQSNVQWDGENRKVTITNNDITIILSIDSNIAIINNVSTQLDLPAEIKNGKTMVPLRFISETFKAKVDWNGSKNQINIASNSCLSSNNIEKPISVEDAIYSVLVNRYDSFNKQDVKGLLNTIDPESIGYNVDWKSNFERSKNIIYTFKNSKLLSTDNINNKAEVSVEFTMRTPHDTGYKQFNGDITVKVTDIFVFHKGSDGFWRFLGGNGKQNHKEELVPNE